MLCCLNPDCQKPQNPDSNKYCQSCRTELALLGGHYRVIRLLSDEGGFGRTYLAEDEQKLNELCVVKQLVPQLQGASGVRKAVELFAEEAKRLQQLGEHPQIPTLYAYFSQDNYFYLVQQYIEGQNLLQELQQKGGFSERQIRELLLDILPVLRFIHEQHVIHRDIKPQNIMRRLVLPTLAQRKSGKLVLIDFGASKQLKATVKQKIATRIGSEGYAPIEQMRGGEAHPASDLFSLGTTCFHLLSQQHPLELWAEYGYSWVLNWRVYVNGPVSNDLGYILDKLLQKDIEQRYQSADEAIGDLTLKPPAPVTPARIQNSQTLKPPAPVTPARIQNIQQPPQFLYRPHVQKKDTQLRNKLLVGSVFLLGLAVYGYFDLLQPFSESANELTVSPTEIIPQGGVTVAGTLRGHLSSVYSVTFSPDGKMLASGSKDKTIKLWNPKTGQEIRTLRGHASQILSVAFSPDGKTLASGSEDNTIKLWNLQTGQEIRTLRGHSSSVSSVSFSPDGKVLASGSFDNTIKLWNLQTGQQIRTLAGHLSLVYSVAFSPDGGTLASGSYDNTVKLWNLTTGKEIYSLTGHSSWIFSVAFSPDGETLASGSMDKTIKLWNLKTGQELYTLTGHTNWVFSVAFSPDGQKLVSGSLDNTIKVWNLKTDEELYTLKGHSDYVSSVTFSPDGQSIASGSADRTIKIWRSPEDRGLGTSK